MELPKYHETFIPILEILNSVESLKSRELASRVRDAYYSDNINKDSVARVVKEAIKNPPELK
jgi:hypothetical protein